MIAFQPNNMKVQRITWDESFKLSLEYFFYTFIVGFIGGFVYEFFSSFGAEMTIVGLIISYFIFSIGLVAVMIKVISDVIFRSFESSNLNLNHVQLINRSNNLATDPNSNNMTVKCRYCGASNSPSNMNCHGCNQKLNFRY